MSRRSSSALALAIALGGAPAAATGGPALDYALNCQGCHRADGAGTPGSVPALAGSVGRFLRVRGGREFLVRVPGVATSALDDAALAAVLDWLLERFDADGVPVGTSRYTAEEVGRLRRSPLTDVQRARQALIEAIERAK